MIFSPDTGMVSAEELNQALAICKIPERVGPGMLLTYQQINLLYEALGVSDRAVACEPWEPHRIRLNALLEIATPETV